MELNFRSILFLALAFGICKAQDVAEPEKAPSSEPNAAGAGGIIPPDQGQPGDESAVGKFYRYPPGSYNYCRRRYRRSLLKMRLSRRSPQDEVPADAAAAAGGVDSNDEELVDAQARHYCNSYGYNGGYSNYYSNGGYNYPYGGQGYYRPGGSFYPGSGYHGNGYGNYGNYGNGYNNGYNYYSGYARDGSKAGEAPEAQQQASNA